MSTRIWIAIFTVAVLVAIVWGASQHISPSPNGVVTPQGAARSPG
jgi:hypothetical protein